MQPTFSRGYCRQEQREARFRFAGYATGDGHENSVRPRAFYRSCATAGCGLVVLTLADVHDALGLCKAVLDENLRTMQTGSPVDVENVLGDLYGFVWSRYNVWNPARTSKFLPYASWVLKQRVKRFIAQDLGYPTANRVYHRAHSSALSVSYEQLREESDTADGDRVVAAFGAVAGDSVGDRHSARGWVDAIHDQRSNRLAGEADTAPSVRAPS